MVYLLYHDLRTDDLESAFSAYITEGDYSGAVQYFSRLTKKRVGARVFLALAVQAKSGRIFSERRAEKAAETEAAACVNSLENGFNFLTTIGSIAPLTGFLGTVTGMISAFRAIAEADEVNAQIVALGIYEALITTVFGLIIAIIAMVSHSIFSHIVDRFIARVEGACSNIIAQMAECAEEAAQSLAANKS
jgi:biopolymer transport protein ExbB